MFTLCIHPAPAGLNSISQPSRAVADTKISPNVGLYFNFDPNGHARSTNRPPIPIERIDDCGAVTLINRRWP